jgi:O-antigen/teichoic acid export membrane protein
VQLARIFQFSLALIGFRFVGIASRQANKFIVAPFLGTVAVGELNIVQRIYQTSSIFGSLISAAVMPAASVAHAEGDWHKLGDMYIRGTKYTIFVCTLVAFCSAVLVEPFLIMWLGQQYASLALLAQMMLATLVFDALVSTGQNMTVGIGRPLAILWVNALAMVFNVVVTVIMLPRVGLTGVIWGLASGSILGNLIQFVIINRLLKVPIWQITSQSVFACVPGILGGGVCAWILLELWQHRTWLEIGLIGIIAVAVGGSLFYFTALDMLERRAVRAWLTRSAANLQEAFSITTGT